MAFNKNAYDTDFKREHYDRIVSLVPKGKGATVKAVAAERGLTVSQVVIRALEETYKIDLS